MVTTPTGGLPESSETSIIGPAIGIAITLALLYFTVFITKAPNLYFMLIFWTLAFALIFDGWASIRAVVDHEPLTLITIMSMINIVLAIAFAVPAFRYWQAVQRAKAQPQA